MRWWKALLIVVVPLVIMVVLQLVLMVVAIVIETAVFGNDPGSFGLTPLMMLATNLSLIVMGPLAVALTALLTKTPWRRVLHSPGRFRVAHLARYAAVFAALIAVGIGAMALIAPEGMGLKHFAVTGATVALVIVALATTPLQAASEELAFRGALMPAISSWIRPARVSLVVGLIASSLVFGISHGSIDPWLATYYTLFGVCMGVMAVITRGLEAPIAFHAVNNLVMMLLASLFADGGTFALDRSVGMGGPFMLIFIAVDLIAVGVVWLLARRQAEA